MTYLILTTILVANFICIFAPFGSKTPTFPYNKEAYTADHVAKWNNIGSKAYALFSDDTKTIIVGQITEKTETKKGLRTKVHIELPSLWPSLFNLPPTLLFYVLPVDTDKLTVRVKKLPENFVRQLTWSGTDDANAILESSHFIKLQPRQPWYLGFGLHLDFPHEMQPHQRISHIPSARSNKSILYDCLREKFSREEYSKIIPATYKITKEEEYHTFDTLYSKNQTKVFIFKPDGGSNAQGIIITDHYAKFKKFKKEFFYEADNDDSQDDDTYNHIVQEYITTPYLIKENEKVKKSKKFSNESKLFKQKKFDLRLYVLVTSLNPLRVYLYKDGVVPFAIKLYPKEGTPQNYEDAEIHLPNHPNKRDNPQPSWTLKNLLAYMEIEGHTGIWDNIKNIVLKVFLAYEGKFRRDASARNINILNDFSSFELFGLDFVLKQVGNNVEPVLMEVNTLPGLGWTANLGAEAVNLPMIADTLNLVGIMLPHNTDFKQSLNYLAKNYHDIKSDDERVKETKHTDEFKKNKEILPEILTDLKPFDLRILTEVMDEIERAKHTGKYELVFPVGPKTKEHVKTMDDPPYSMLLLAQWLEKPAIKELVEKCDKAENINTDILVK